MTKLKGIHKMETKKNKVTRRKFIKTSVKGMAVAAFAAPYIIPKSVRGANDQINLAVIGIRGRGGSQILEGIEHLNQ